MQVPGGHPQGATAAATAAGAAPPGEAGSAASDLPDYPLKDVCNASVNSYAGTLVWLRPPDWQKGLPRRLVSAHPRNRPRRIPHPVTVHVWLHFGIHWVKAASSNKPLHHDAPFPSRDDTGSSDMVGRCHFQPLRRRRQGEKPTWTVTTRRVSSFTKAFVRGPIVAEWNQSPLSEVVLEFPGDPTADGLTFIAPQTEAEKWKRQLELRAVPLETVRASRMANAVEVAPQGTAATNGTTGSPAMQVDPARPHNLIAQNIQQVLQSNLATPLIELFLSVATSASGGASISVLLAPLIAGAAVCRSVQALPVVAAELRSKVRGLGEALTGSIYPAVKLLEGLPGETTTDGPFRPVLLDSIDALASDLDAMLGRLFNISLMSTKQRISQSGGPGGRSPEAVLMDKVDALKAEVKDLLDVTMIQLVSYSVGQLGRVTAEVEQLRQAQEAAARHAQDVAARQEREAAAAAELQRLAREASARFVRVTTPPRAATGGGGGDGPPAAGHSRPARKRDWVKRRWRAVRNR